MLLLLFGGDTVSVSGALQAASVEISASSASIVRVNGTLASSSAAIIASEGAVVEASGALEAAAVSLDGGATAPELRAIVSWAEIQVSAAEASSAARGELAADAASIEGSGSVVVAVSGALQASDAGLTVTDSVQIEASGELSSGGATLAADVAPVPAVAGALAAQTSTINGSTHFTAIAFTGALQANAAQISGAASLRRKIRTAVAPRHDYPLRSNVQMNMRRSNVQGRWIRRTG